MLCQSPLSGRRTGKDRLYLKYKGPFFDEFVTASPIPPQKVEEILEEKGILGGLPVDGGILWCATEMNSKEDMDEMVAILKGGMGHGTSI